MYAFNFQPAVASYWYQMMIPMDSDDIGSKGITTHWFVLCLWLYQRSRVKLWDHMVEENCEVCRPRLQQLNTLETGTLAIDLRKSIHLLDRMMIMWPKNQRHLARYLFLWWFKVVVFCSNNLRVYEVRRATRTALGIGVLCDIIEVQGQTKRFTWQRNNFFFICRNPNLKFNPRNIFNTFPLDNL